MKKLWFVLLIGLLSSCKGSLEKVDAPKDLIPHDKMVELLADIMVLEAHIQSRYQNVQRFHKIMTTSGKTYLKSKGLTVEQYERSFTYYVSESDEMQEIILEAEERLTIKSNRLQGTNEIKDTI